MNEATYLIKKDSDIEKLTAEDKKDRSCSEKSINYILKGGEYTICFLIGIPVAFLSCLAVLARDENINLGELKTPGEFMDLLKGEEDLAHLSYAIFAFIAGGGVTVFIAKRHFVTACKTTFELFKDIFYSIYCCGDENKKISVKSLFLDIFLFIWSISTALIFGKIGSEALSFFELPGVIAGFVLKFLLASTTRYMSARVMLKNQFNKNWKLKQHYLVALSSISEETLRSFEKPSAVQIHAQGQPQPQQADIDAALVRYLSHNAIQDLLRKNTARKISLNIVPKTLGFLLFGSTIVSAITCFIPKAVQGVELLINHDIGEDDDYKNADTFVLGFFFSLLSVIFYELNTTTLPYQLILTFFLFIDNLKNRDYKEAITLLGLTVLAMSMSYGNAIGVGYVGETLVNQGYLSYMPSAMTSLIPEGLTLCTMCMVWSNLQKLINGRKYNAVATNPTRFFKVDVDNVRTLLNNPKTNIQLLPQGSLFQSKNMH